MSVRHTAGAAPARPGEAEALGQEVERLREQVARDLGLLERERIFAERLSRLHAFTAALADAESTGDIAAAIVKHGRAAVGARGVALWLRDPRGSARLSSQLGFSAAFEEHLAAVPRGAATAPGLAIATGAADWTASGERLESRWPGAEAWLAPDLALSTLPLEAHSGRLGALAVATPSSSALAIEERAMLVAFARQGAQALERAALLDAERRARADAEAEHDRAAFLYEASALLSSSLDLEDTLASVARLAVPRVADWYAVELAEDVAPGGARGGGPVVRSREPELYEEVGDEVLLRIARDAEQLRAWRELGRRSAMIVPMSARGRLLGTITFVSAESHRRYGPSDLAMAASLARRCGLAIDNARLYAEAQRAIRTRDDVLAIVSHDLRNPLHAIVMASNLLQRSSSPERARQHAATIERSARRAGRLIRDLLDLSTLESGRVSLDCGRVDVTTLLSDAAALIQPIAAERTIALEVATAPGRPLDAWCDRERIIQVFSNLLGNAVSFTPAGGRVTLAAAPAETEIRFSVADTGPGVPAEHQSHIFDRYWKTRESREGAGLGLSIARGIVDAHGGRIWVESAPGSGATFLFTVPRAPR